MYSKNFKTKQKRFGVFQNLKAEHFFFFQKRKTKTILSAPKIYFGKTELFECFKKFKNKTNHLLMEKNVLDLKENVLV